MLFLLASDLFKEEIAKLADPPGGADPAQVFRCGLTDTDKGKFDRYKTLLTRASDDPAVDGAGDGNRANERRGLTKSDLLFNTLRGVTEDPADPSKGPNAQAVEQLRAYLDTLGYENRPTILNPDAGEGPEGVSNAQMREAFKKSFMLVGWLHDLPGVADAIELLRNGVISPDVFRETVAIALFHNGPAAGFWGFLTGSMANPAPGAFGFPDEPTRRLLFSGTVYEAAGAKVGQALGYPMPTTYFSLVHVVLDRLSQGTRGGVHKIWEELRFVPGNTVPSAIHSVVVTNQTGTIAQLRALDEHVRALPGRTKRNGEPLLTAAQAESLGKFIRASIDTVSKLESGLARRVKTVKEKIDGKDVVVAATLQIKGVGRTYGEKADLDEGLRDVLKLMDELGEPASETAIVATLRAARAAGVIAPR